MEFIGWINTLFYVSGFCWWAIFFFKFGRVVTDAIWWACVDVSRVSKGRLRDGVSKWRWLLIIPRRFCKSFWQTLADRMNGWERQN